MIALIGCSAFFSASEAALFCLRATDRKQLAAGSPAQRLADRLLQDPDRLLSAVLFWNLVINIVYFAMASIVALQLDRSGPVSQYLVVGFSTTAVLLLVFLSEMLPKSLAVLRPGWLAASLSLPLSMAVRLVDPVMPALRTVMLLSQRLVWPGFDVEAYLEIGDLERAIEMSRRDAALMEQERKVLTRIVSLSDVKVQEWMRPRKQFVLFRPPVQPADLGGQVPASGYVLVTDKNGDDVVSAFDLRAHGGELPDRIDDHALDVSCVPWCATVAETLQKQQEEQTDVAVIVNEFGETIGVLSRWDILEAVFSDLPGRSERLLHQDAIEEVEPGVWLVTGITNLSRLSARFDIKLPRARSVTLRGLLQQELERLPMPGDRVKWGPFELEVVSPAADKPQVLLVRISLASSKGDGA